MFLVDAPSLHHQLLYHSLESERHILNTFTDDLNKNCIAFYQTNKMNALSIAQNGFPLRDNLQLKQRIFFTPSCTSNLNAENTILCVRLNLGRVITIDDNGDLNLNQ